MKQLKATENMEAALLFWASKVSNININLKPWIMFSFFLFWVLRWANRLIYLEQKAKSWTITNKQTNKNPIKSENLESQYGVLVKGGSSLKILSVPHTS